MTLSKEIYDAVVKAFGDAFVTQRSASAQTTTTSADGANEEGDETSTESVQASAAASTTTTTTTTSASDEAVIIELPTRTALIADMMAGLEPSSAECGQMTRAAVAEFTRLNGREPTEEEATRGQTATFESYVTARLRYARSFLAHPRVKMFVAMFDRGSPPAKFPEQNTRYGSDSDDVASDGEVAEVLAGSMLPHEWKRFRGNPRFRDAVMSMLVASLIATPLERGKKLCIVGNPTTPRNESHYPVIYEAGAAPVRITTPSSCNDYFEADFGVVHMATEMVRLKFNAVVRAIDGDTLLALMLNAPRTVTCVDSFQTALQAQYAAMRACASPPKRARTGEAPVPGAETQSSSSRSPPPPPAWTHKVYMLREMPGSRSLIDIQSLYMLANGPAAAHIVGHSTRPRCLPELVTAVAMLLGNDYAIKFMPRVGGKTLLKAFRELADEMSTLVTSTPARTLAEDLRNAHEIRVSRSTLQRLVDHLYQSKGMAALKPSSQRIDVATAILEYALNYFANAPNTHVPPVDAYARAPSGLSLHGFEWINPELPPTRLNARLAERVHVEGRFV